MSSLSLAPHQHLSTSPHLSWNHSGSSCLDVHCSYITISQILPTPLRPTPSTATQGITGKSRSGHGHPSLCQYHLVVASQLVWNECQSVLRSSSRSAPLCPPLCFLVCPLPLFLALQPPCPPPPMPTERRRHCLRDFCPCCFLCPGSLASTAFPVHPT